LDEKIGSSIRRGSVAGYEDGSVVGYEDGSVVGDDEGSIVGWERWLSSWI
jgi:hypothetical protein